MLLTCVWIIVGTIAALLLGAGFLHAVPRLGSAGRALAEHLCRAPLLDLLITYFTIVPMIAGLSIAGWRGLAAGIIGQVIAPIRRHARAHAF